MLSPLRTYYLTTVCTERMKFQALSIVLVALQLLNVSSQLFGKSMAPMAADVNLLIISDSPTVSPAPSPPSAPLEAETLSLSSAPTTLAPTTSVPTTLAPTTSVPTTLAPASRPTTPALDETVSAVQTASSGAKLGVNLICSIAGVVGGAYVLFA